MNQKLRSTSGFTLLEILIAIGIMAIMTVAITNITNSITNMRDETIMHNDVRHSVTLALTKMTDDLRVSFLADTKFVGAEKKFVTGFFGEEQKLDFSTMSNVHYLKNNRDTDQVNVGYYLENSESGGYNLMRRQTDRLSEAVKEGGKAFVLIGGVENLKFEFYDANKKEWVKTWDTDSISSGGALPQIVRINLTVFGEPEDPEDDDSERVKYDYTLDVPIEMYNKKVSF